MQKRSISHSIKSNRLLGSITNGYCLVCLYLSIFLYLSEGHEALSLLKSYGNFVYLLSFHFCAKNSFVMSERLILNAIIWTVSVICVSVFFRKVFSFLTTLNSLNSLLTNVVALDITSYVTLLSGIPNSWFLLQSVNG